jgi:hypothetical protein
MQMKLMRERRERRLMAQEQATAERGCRCGHLRARCLRQGPSQAGQP